MARIRFEGVTRHFPGAAAPAVGKVNLDVDDGEVAVITGPAESGKTTLLRLAAGLELPDEGRVLVGDGQDTGPADAEIALVFQNYAIYPNLSVRKNVAVPLKGGEKISKEVAATVDDVLGLLGLSDVANTSASSLPASDRMRVVLARSLVRRPDVLLMDEPLANLQPQVRDELMGQLVVAQQAFRTTTLYAAADSDEVPPFGGRTVLMQGGLLSEP